MALNSRGRIKYIKLSPEGSVGQSGRCIFSALFITWFIVVSERFRMISSRMFRIHLVIGCFNVLCFGQHIPQGNHPRESRGNNRGEENNIRVFRFDPNARRVTNFRVEPKPPIYFFSPDYLLLIKRYPNCITY